MNHYIAVTIGDINGIGIHILIKSWKQKKIKNFILFCNKNEIENAIKKCLYNNTFIKKCKTVKNPYGGGESGEKIAKTLANITRNKKIILRKKMTIK